MKKTYALLAACILLSGCAKATMLYTIGTDVTDASKVDELTVASMRVVQRRLERMGETPLDITIVREAGENRLRVELKNKASMSILTEELVTPFKIRIMEEAPADEPGTIAVEAHGSFRETGIENEHFVWMTSEADTTPGKGRITIEFTEEGRQMMSDVFEKNVGKSIGIFVRDRLVSKLQVETDELKDKIIITDIPSLDLAHVFADDVNVGLHVTFTPVQ